MGKRYYYNSKGRYKGKSSSTFIADGKTYKMLGIMAVIAVGGNVLFGNDEPDGQQQVEMTEDVEQAASITEAIERPAIAEPIIESPTETSEPLTEVASPAETRETTEQYMQREYVNGDPNCPRDIIEYHQTQCEAGEVQSCSIAQCGSQQ